MKEQTNYDYEKYVQIAQMAKNGMVGVRCKKSTVYLL